MTFLKRGLTLLIATVAAVSLWQLYEYYTYSPQTRDGKTRADVVPLAADVSGRVAEVLVRDNQHVKKGDVLFKIDRARLGNALDQADAAVKLAHANLASAERESLRSQALVKSAAVSAQQLDMRSDAVAQARARLEQAIAEQDLARINLDRTEVRSPVNGLT